MKTLLIAFAILLATGGGLAVMNNACKTSLHAWCAPKSSHVSAGPSAKTWQLIERPFDNKLRNQYAGALEGIVAKAAAIAKPD